MVQGAACVRYLPIIHIFVQTMEVLRVTIVLQWRCICVTLHLLRRVYRLIYLKAGSVWGDFLTMTGERGEEEEVHEPEAPEVSENV